MLSQFQEQVKTSNTPVWPQKLWQFLSQKEIISVTVKKRSNKSWDSFFYCAIIILQQLQEVETYFWNFLEFWNFWQKIKSWNQGREYFFIVWFPKARSSLLGRAFWELKSDTWQARNGWTLSFFKFLKFSAFSRRKINVF